MSSPYDPYRLPSGRPHGQPPAETPARPPTTVHPRPEPYHRLLLTWRYRWWRPLFGLAVLAAAFVVLTIAVSAGFAVAEVVRTGGPFEEALGRFGQDVDPLFLLANNLSLAVAIPAAMLAMVLANRMRPGWLSSVAGRLRWGLLLRMTGLALVVVVAFTVVSGFVPVGDGVPDVGDVELVSLSTWLAFAVVVVLTTPLQAAAEEYAFRGYGFQALGAWFRTPWVGAIVTSLAFAFAHGTQNMPLFLDRFAFGLIACWLVVRTGGLEAAIALHVVINTVIFLISAAVDEVTDAVLISEIPWSVVAFDIGQMLVFALVADRYVRRRAYRSRSAAW